MRYSCFVSALLFIVLTRASLAYYFSVTIDAGSFSLNLLSKGMMESPRLQMVIPQSSQTEWSDAVSIGLAFIWLKLILT